MVELDDSLRKFSTGGEQGGEKFLLYKSGDKICAQKDTTWNRFWSHLAFWRSYNFDKVVKDLMTAQVQTHKAFDPLFYKNLDGKFKKYIKLHEPPKTELVANKVMPKAAQPQPGVQREYAMLERVASCLPCDDDKARSLNEKYRIFSDKAGKGHIFSTDEIKEIRKLYHKIVSFIAQHHLPQAPKKAPKMASTTSFSKEELAPVETLVRKLASIYLSEPASYLSDSENAALVAKNKQLALEVKECAIFLLANCKDLLEQLKSEKTAPQAIDELRSRLLRYKDALAKFPQLIVELNKVLMAQVDLKEGLPVEKRQLLMIFGDAFLRSSGFEESAPTTDYMRLAKETLSSSRSLLKDPRILSALENPVDLSQVQEPNKVAATAKKEVEKQGLCLLVGGWQGNAVNYTIEKQFDDKGKDTGKYKFKVYNAGSGAQKYHAAAHVGLKGKVQPFLEITDVSADVLFKTGWLEQLAALTQVSQELNGKKPPAILYETLLPLLGGKISAPDTDKNSLMSPARSGTYPWKSLLACASSFMGKKECKVFKFRIKVAALENYATYLHKKVHSQESIRIEDIEGLTHAKKKLSAALNKIRKDPELVEAILPAELKRAQELIDQIEEFVTIAKATDAVSAKQKGDQLVAAMPAFAKKTHFGDPEYMQTFNVKIEIPKCDPEPSAEAAKALPAKLEDALLTWTPKPETIVCDIKNFAERCHKCEDAKEKIDFYHRLTEKLIQHDPTNTKLWKDLSFDDARAVIQALSTIAREGEKAASTQLYINNQYSKPYLNQEMNVIANIHLLGAMQAVAKNLPKDETLLYTQDDVEEELTAMMIPQDLFENSSFRVTDNPAHNQYLSDLAKQYPQNLQSQLFHEKVVDNYSMYDWNKCTALKKAFEKWLTNPKNEAFVRQKMIEMKLPKKYDEIEAENRPGYLWNFKESLLPAPFVDLLKQAVQLKKSYIFETHPFFQPIQHPSLNLLLQKIFGTRTSENDLLCDIELPNKLKVEKQKQPTLSLEEVRDLLAIRSQKEFQIPLTLAHFSKQLNKLKDRDYQTIFESLLFEDAILQDDLKASPFRAMQIANFIRSSYELFESQQDVETCAHLLHLAAKLADYSKGEINPFAVEAKSASTTIRERLNELISKLEKTEDSPKKLQRLSLLHAVRMASFSSRISQKEVVPTKEELTDIFFSRQFLIQNPVADEQVSQRREREIEKTLSYAKPHFEALATEKEARNELLNALLTKISGKKSENDWKETPKYPLFQTEDGVFLYDFSTGDLFNLKDTKAVQRLPKSVREDSDFISIFGLKELPCCIFSRSLFQVKDAQGIEYRIRIADDGKAIIFRKLGEPASWHQFTPTSTRGASQVPSLLLTQNYEKWTSITSPQKMYYVHPATKKAAYVLETHLVFKLAAEKRSDFYLVSPDEYLIGENGPLSPTHQFLKDFEMSSRTHLWKSDKDNKLELEFPLFCLNFSCDNNEKTPKWKSTEHPGFFLSSNQSVANLGNTKGYLVLENDKGQKKVLIPNQPIKEQPGMALNFPVTFDQTVVFQKGYLEYRIGEKGVLDPQKDIAARFHLAAIFLAQSRYEEASKLLQPAVAEISERSYTDDELLCLQRLIQVRAAPGSNDIWGQAVAVRLHARALLEQNREKMNDEESTDPKALKQEYEMLKDELLLYYNQYNNTQGVRLDPNEEMLLIKKCTKLINRLTELKEKEKDTTKRDAIEIPILNSLLSNRQRAIESQQFEPSESDALTIWPSELQPAAPSQAMESMRWGTGLSEYLTKYKKQLEESETNPPLFAPALSKNDPGFATYRSLATLHDKIVKAKTDVEKRKIFVLLYPLIPKSSPAKAAETYACLLLKLLFADELTRVGLPQKFSDLCNQVASIEDHKRDTYISNLLKDFKLPESVDNWISKPVDILAYHAVAGAIGPSIKAEPKADKKAHITVAPISMKELASPKEELSVVKIDNYFNIKEERVKDAEAMKKQFDEVFTANQSEAAQETIVKKYYESVRNDIAVSLQKTTKTYQLKDGADVSGLISTLQTELDSQKDQLQFQENQILFLAHKPTTDEKLRAEFTSGKRTYPTMNELFIYFGQGNWQLLKERNPALTDEDITKLRALILTHLLEKTKAQKTERCLNLAVAANDLEKGLEKDEAFQSLAEAMSATRAYNPAEKPNFLVFENFTGLLIRKDQVDLMELFFKGEPVAKQLIMGAGKTTVASVLISLLLADGKRIAALTVPKTLLPSVAEITRTTLGGGFEKKVVSISYKREYLSEEYLKTAQKTPEVYLQELLRTLMSIKENGHILLTTPETRHSLKLASEEGIAVEGLSEKAKELLREIQTVYRTLVHEVIDEIDQVLSPRLEFNYSIGEKRVYDVKKGRMLAKLTVEASKTPFTQVGYQNTKEKLADYILDSLLKDKSVLEGDAQKNADTLSRLTAEQRGYLKDYLTGTTDAKIAIEAFCKTKNLSEKAVAKAEAVLRKNPNATLPEELGLKGHDVEQFREKLNAKIGLDNKIGTYVATLPADLREHLATSTALLNTILPSALEKVIGEQYGYRKDPLNPVACPYENSAPKDTEFASPEEQIAHSALTIRAQGLKAELVLDYLQKLYTAALKESNTYRKPIQKTAAFEEYEKLRGPHNAAIDFTQLTLESIGPIVANINSNPDLQLPFMNTYLLPKIEVYPNKVSSTPYKLANSSNTSSGFTGTLETSLLPRQMKGEPEAGTNARTLVAFARKMNQGSSKVVSLEGPTQEIPSKIMSALTAAKSNENPDPPMVLIDSGGMLKKELRNGDSRAQFAEQLLKQMETTRPKIRGIVFHNEEGKLVTLQKKGDAYVTVFLSDSNLKEDERMTIIAMPFCTGTNVPQTPTARALMTMGKNTKMRDFLQSIFRMRGILKQQNVNLLVSDEVAKSIRELLKLPDNTRIDDKIIARFIATLQCLRLADENLLAAKQKMQAVIQDAVDRRGIELTKKKQGNDAELLYQGARDLFVQKEHTALYPAYKAMASYVTGEERIEQLVETHLEAIVPILEKQPEICKDVITQAIAEKCYTLPVGETVDALSGATLIKRAKEAMKATLKSCANKDDIREVLPAVSMDLGKEVEREREVEKEVEMQVQVEAEKPKVAVPEILDRPWKHADAAGRPNLLHWKENFAINESPLPQLRDSQIQKQPNTFGRIYDLLPSYCDKNAFSKNISYSINFVGSEDSIISAKLDPFGKTQKTGYQVLVIQQANKPPRTLLVSLKDAAGIKNAMQGLQAREKAQLASEGVQLSLFDPIAGLDMTTAQIAPDPLKDDTLLKHLVQVKFLNGSLTYNEKEIAYLRTWLNDMELVDLKALEAFLKGMILQHRQESAKAYEAGSVLKLLFEEAIKAKSLRAEAA